VRCFHHDSSPCALACFEWLHPSFEQRDIQSPEEAHQKAWALGQQEEHSCDDTDGRRLTGVFRGLGEMNVIHDELEHGAELIYRERVGLSEEQICALVKPKAQLGVFAPREPAVGPNYMPKSVMDELRKDGLHESEV
jgi:hypothetical protein